MQWIALAPCLFSQIAIANAAPASPPLQFITHELAPLNFSDNGKPVGFCVDLVRELSKRTGTQAPIMMMPFVRGYHTATTTPNVGLFFTTRTADREALFSWVGPIATTRNDFFVRADSALKVDSVDDLRKVKTILVHRGSHNEQALVRLGFKNVVPFNRPEEGVRLLAENLYADAVLLLTSAAVPQALKKYKLDQNAVKPVFLARKLQGFIAFSKGTPPDVVERYQSELDGMKRDGSFDALHLKWMPTESPPGIKPEPNIDNLAG